MHVHVHRFRRQLQEKHRRRVRALGEGAGPGLRKRRQQQAVPHSPAVDEQVEVVAVAEAQVRRRHEAPQAPGQLAVHEGHQASQLLAQEGRQPLTGIVHRRQHQGRAAVGAEGPVHARRAEGEPRHGAPELGMLGVGGFQEPPTGRQLGEEIPHGHGGAAAPRGGRHLLDDTELAAQAVTSAFGLGAGKVEAAHAGDARQGLPAEPEGAQVAQVLRRAHLAGGVALQGQVQVIPGHAGAIVGHLQQTLAALFPGHLDAAGPGVQGVLHQLFQHGGGALHHLPGGDLVGHLVGQDPDAGHG
ncbi:MAG: hypothetical protein H6P99_2665 [Holophagaceae bacterium]|nr:hypothetical protein [Holophagaceae bacterium]